MKRRKPLATGFLATSLALSQIGCGVELLGVAILIGKVVLFAAVTRVTIRLVDQIIGENQKQVSDAVIANTDDPDRGIIRSMRVGKSHRDGTPTGELVTFENVPVVKNSSGRWIVEKYYCDQVMAPRLQSIE